MRTVRESEPMNVPVATARSLWTDTTRWPTFVDGFARVVELDERWPRAGSKVVWESGPAGRGRVTEKVVEHADDRFVTDVFEDQLTGRQTVWFQPDGLVMELAYELQGGGPLRGLTDMLFIRRALTDALRRTLRRFSTEAAEQASL